MMRKRQCLWTTLDIVDDVLAAAEERARREHTPMGQVVSELMRHALMAPREASAIYGVPPFASRDAVVTNDLIGRLRQGDAY